MSDLDGRGQRYDSTRRAWEEIWQTANVDAELKAVQYRRAKATLEAYRPYLPKDAPILEAGSGLSAVVVTLRRMGYPVIGLDYAVNALRAADAAVPGQSLVAGDVHGLPFADGSLGAYLSFGVLEHFEQGMQPALAEARRVLRPGGVLVLTIPYPNVVWRLAQFKRALQGSQLIDEDFYESTYSRSDLIDNVVRSGFSVTHVQPTSHSFTLWGLGGVFRAPGYYRTSLLAEGLGDLSRVVVPWAMNFMTLIVAHK